MPIQFLSVIGGGGQQVPFDRRNAPTTTVAYNMQDSMRIRAYEEKWRFYAGQHWSFQREDGEPLVTFNYSRTVVNKIATWMVGKGIAIKIPDAVQEITGPHLKGYWSTTQGQTTLWEMAISGGVSGDVFMLTTWEEPTRHQLMVNPNARGHVRTHIYASHQVFPTWDPLDMERLLVVRIVTEVHDQRPDMSLSFSPAGLATTQGARLAANKRRYVQLITAEKIVEGWEDDPESRTERPNILGEIPLVHITNLKFPNEYFGLSDLDGIIDVQRELNEKATDISDIVNYHASPVTVITGAKAKQLDKGPRSIWSGLPADAKVFNLPPAGDLTATHHYLEMVKTALFDISGIPEGSLGRIQNISNTSAAALQVQFQPLIEVIERKSPYYARGIEKSNYFHLRYLQIYEDLDLPVDLCESCGGRIVEFPVTDQDGKPVLTWSGKQKTKKKCYLVDPQTLEFQDPEDVAVNVKRKHSFGVETRLMPFKQAKKEYLEEGASFWDPAEQKNLEEKAKEDQERNRKIQEFHSDQEQEQQEHAAAQEPVEAHPETGEPLPPKEPPPKKELPPKELEKEPEVKPEQLAPHDIDLPEEPETIQVTIRQMNPVTLEWSERDLGEIKVVPTGCKRPCYLNPFKNEVTFKSPLPRDKEKDTNLMKAWQDAGWVSRRFCQDNLDEGINPMVEDKQIADDVPFLLAMQGKPDPAGGVAQTAGLDPGQAPPGSNNGAPLPPGPGPGRGNMHAPGDNLASKAPANGAPGEKV